MSEFISIILDKSVVDLSGLCEAFARYFSVDFYQCHKWAQFEDVLYLNLRSNMSILLIEYKAKLPDSDHEAFFDIMADIDNEFGGRVRFVN